MSWLFGGTLFVSAALLFVAQPMIARSLLPFWGGTPAVWNTCMVFYQAALLAGYGYAHALSRRPGGRQVLVHAVILILPALCLPFAAPTEPHSAVRPAFGLLVYLAATAGLPLVVVATTAPLLQRWFANVDRRDPYTLYAASNAGSLLALAAYPLAIEPNLDLPHQAWAWAAGYGLLVVLTLGCGLVVWRKPGTGAAASALRASGRGLPLRFGRWVALAFVPSSWLLGVTTYITTDIAPVPLLWVVPLGLYLLSFVLVFARGTQAAGDIAARVLPLLVFPLAVVLGLGLAQAFWLPLHLLVFFAGALVCHGQVARDRPDAHALTAFYLALAIGGVLGGVFNALVAPVLFDRLTEYPLAIVLGCVALPASPARGSGLRFPRIVTAIAPHLVWIVPLAIFGLIAVLVRNVGGVEPTPLGAALELLASGLVVFAWYRHRSHPVRFALALGAALLASGLSDGLSGRALYRERNFFGTVRVTVAATPRGEVHRLFLGNTLHGQQSLDPARRREPLAYFHRNGPIGQVFSAFPVRSRVAIVGLGAGALAAYARPTERWTFYELDPAVIRVARDPRYFTFLDDSRAGAVDVVEGDARLRLRETPAHRFDLIVLDAFSSDAVPTHLLTREALQLYRAKLADGGLIVFNITNRYLDLEPVIGALARDAAMPCRVRYDVQLSKEEQAEGKQGSIWVVLARSEAALGAIGTDSRWRAARSGRHGNVWRDNFSDPARYLVLRRRFPIRTGRGS